MPDTPARLTAAAALVLPGRAIPTESRHTRLSEQWNARPRP